MHECSGTSEMRTPYIMEIEQFHHTHTHIISFNDTYVHDTYYMSVRHMLFSVLYLSSFFLSIGQDESHFLKNYRTARSKAALPILKVHFNNHSLMIITKVGIKSFDLLALMWSFIS